MNIIEFMFFVNNKEDFFLNYLNMFLLIDGLW
jgi:hypothetical protein